MAAAQSLAGSRQSGGREHGGEGLRKLARVLSRIRFVIGRGARCVRGRSVEQSDWMSLPSIEADGAVLPRWRAHWPSELSVTSGVPQRAALPGAQCCKRRSRQRPAVRGALDCLSGGAHSGPWRGRRWGERGRPRGVPRCWLPGLTPQLFYRAL